MNYIISVINPKYWIQLYPYSKEWDKKLNELMSKNKFEPVNKHEAKIGEVTVWIDNHPYGSFHPVGLALPKVRPSRSTIRKAMIKLHSDFFENLGLDKSVGK